MSVDRRFIKRVPLAAVTAAVCSLALLGCADGDAAKSKEKTSGSGNSAQTTKSELQVISAAQLHALVKESREPILVEFGVDVHCVRCDKMRPEIGRLASEFEGRAKVVRVDFIENSRLVAQYGGEICPTYVLFRDGKPHVTRSYPTSVELLTADLNAAAASNR